MAQMTEKTGAPGEDSVLSYVDNMMLSIEEMDPSLGKSTYLIRSL